MRLLFLGSDSPQSRATLDALLMAGIEPVEVLMHAPTGARLTIPLLGGNADSLPAVAARHGLPARQVSTSRLPELAASSDAEILLVSCYPARVPERVLTRFPGGGYNIHPSPLPAWRGPSPIFWQLRAGKPHIGVSLHAMTGRYDSGPLLGRCRFPVQRPLPWSTLHARAGRLGARLVEKHLIQPGARRTPRAQDESRASCHPAPRMRDFEVASSWSVEHALNFIQGVSGIGRPWVREDTGEVRFIRSASAASMHAPGSSEASVFRLADGALTLITWR